MPDNMNFQTIPFDLRSPGPRLEVDHTRAVRGLVSPIRRMVYFANRFSSGQVAAGVLTRIVNPDEAAKAYGCGSQAHEMAVAARKANGYVDIWMVALDDLVAGAAATGTLTVSGPATASGTIALYINGQRLQVGVSAGDSANTIASSLAAVINLYVAGPVTASVATNVVTLTARHKGLFTNDIDVRLNYYAGEVLPGGVGVAVAGMAGGTGNPDVTLALTAIASESFYDIVSPYNDLANITAIENVLVGRWGGTDMRTGHLFGAYKGTLSTLTTFGTGRNSPHSSFIGFKSSPNATYQWASAWAAVCEFSGANDPAQPLQNQVIPGILAPAKVDMFTDLERELQLKSGISTFTVDQGGNVITGLVITTYQTNVYGIPDVSLLRLETKWTVDYMRYAWRARIAMVYPRHKLADDGTNFDPAQKVATPNSIRGELIAVARQLELVGLLEDLPQFIKDLRVVRSLTNRNQVNAVIPPNIVNQFDIFAAAIQYIL